jgi:hypothetical protein
VLKHVESEEEYESLRATLFELHDSATKEDWLEPDPQIKKMLMQEFASERKGRFMIWLNSLFAMPEISWYRQPGWRYALATACVAGLAIFFVNRNSYDIHGLENQTSEVQNTAGEKSDSADVNGNLFAENLPKDQFPAAPLPIIAYATSEAQNSSVTEDAPAPATEETISVNENLTVTDDVSLEESEKFVPTANSTSKEANAAKLEDRKKLEAGDIVSKTPAIAPTTDQLSLVTISSGQANSCCSPTTNLTTISAEGISKTYSIDESDFVVMAMPNSSSVAGLSDLLDVLYTAP